MGDFEKVENPKSWVWRWFDKSSTAARCTVCLKVLKTDRTTSCLIQHLKNKHDISKESSGHGSSAHGAFPSSRTNLLPGTSGSSAPENSSSSSRKVHPNTFGFSQPVSSFGLLIGNSEEESPPHVAEMERPPRKKQRQLQMDSFVSKKHSMKTDVLRLICEDNMTMNQVVKSNTIRRLLSQTYPSEQPLPKSGSTVTKYLREAAAEAREKLRIAFRTVTENGSKLCISFDEATMLGSDRYLTLNVHHYEALVGNSRVAALGLIRVDERATGEFLRCAIASRLHTVGLETKNIAVASTDGAFNVLRAVNLLGIQKQKCFAHGLDLVVRKAVYGSHSLAFDAAILIVTSEEGDLEAETDCETESEQDGASEDGADPERQSVAVSLGEVVERVRSVVRELKKKTTLMDEIRRITKRPEFNAKELRPILDSRTRWYSTLIMMERTIEIFPALRNVVSRYTTPLSDTDLAALKAIVDVLAPFKKGILMLCEARATLLSADRVFVLILRELRKSESDLAAILLTELKIEISKRRTCLSSALALLDDPRYKFDLEAEIGVQEPSDDDILEALTSIVGVEVDFSESDEEDPPELTWDSVLAASTFSNRRKSRNESCTMENLRRELAEHRAGHGRGRFLTLCHKILLAVPPTSVQPERDFSVVKNILGENRGRIDPKTLDDIFVLKKVFAADVM